MRRRSTASGDPAGPVRAATRAPVTCARCARQGSASCDECPLGALVELDGDGVLTNDDVEALNRLAAAGLIPQVKYLGAA